MRCWFVLVALVGGCGDNKPGKPSDARTDAFTDCTPVRGTTLALEPVAHGCGLPDAPARPDCMDGVVTLVTSPPSDPRLFALELAGRIRILEREQLRPQPFLDLSFDAGGPVNGVGISELGLLGLAFHPQYATNRQFYVFYTRDNPDSSDLAHPYLDVLSRFTTSATDPSVADRSSEVVLLSIPDPFANHNGGMIAFGRDGYLYIGTGDGGGTAAMDASANSQDPTSLLGKMLRISVDRTDPGKAYAIPPENPFALGGGAPEIWMLGLRNPWRWSFDRQTGDLWIGDVGGAQYEELDVLKPGEQAGVNLGWPMYEAMACYKPPCDPTNMTFPLDSRDHADGWWSIIGGEVYRGSCYPDLVGTYVYTDTGAQNVSTARLQPDGTLDIDPPGVFVGIPASLHGDARGELYITTVPGNIFRIVVQP